MTDPNLPGFGHAQPNCAPSCFEQTNIYNFGLGVVRSGSWLVQDPLLSGEGSTEAYLPAQKIAISAVVTFLPGAFDAQGNYSNFSEQIFQALGAYLAPDDAPPSSRLAGHGEGLGSHVAARRVLTVVLTGMESRQAAVRSLTGRRRKLEFWMAGGR
jgi:hypothetical protein